MDLRGVVVDIQEKNGTVIVLTPDGDVREVLTNGQQFQIGDEILFYEKVVEPPKKAWWKRRAVRYATATAAAVLLFCGNPFQISDLCLDTIMPKNMNLGELTKPDKAYAEAYVYIESKSNVKVGVKDQKVVSVDALNKSAGVVLREMGKNISDNIDEFMRTYFKEAKESGYLKPGDPVVVTIVSSVPKSEKNNLLKRIKAIGKQNCVKAIAVAVPNEIVKKAEVLGVTPGKLVIFLVAKETGQVIPPDKLKTASVAELVNTVPHVVEVLPLLAEEKLAELAKNTDIFMVSAPSDNQPTETTNIEKMPVSNEVGNIMASNTATKNTITDVSNDTQTTDITVADSTTNQSESVDSTGASSSSEQPKEQSDSQVQETSTVNNEQQPDSQKQEEDQTQDQQTQESKLQDDQVQESKSQEGQKQEEQKQEEQALGQVQEEKPQQDKKTQDDQVQESKPQENQKQMDQEQEEQTPGKDQEEKSQQDNKTQDDQVQQGEQTQDNQSTNKDEEDKPKEDKDLSVLVPIFELVGSVFDLG